MDLRKYHGTTIAPYWRFRPTGFYGDVYAGGTYTGDIQYCSWKCDHCWSKYGWHGLTPRHELEAEAVAVKLIAGMERNAQAMARISGGEPTMYWEHVVELCRVLLERTRGQVMKIPGVTSPSGDPMGLIIETNGSTLTYDKLDLLDQSFGEGGVDAKRLVIAFGIKATGPEGLAALTGMADKAAAAAHQRQLDALMYAGLECRNLVVHAGFIDKFTDMAVYAAIQRELERAKPGAGRNMLVQRFVGYAGTNRYYTPKRFREPVDPEIGVGGVPLDAKQNMRLDEAVAEQARRDAERKD